MLRSVLFYLKGNKIALPWLLTTKFMRRQSGAQGEKKGITTQILNLGLVDHHREPKPWGYHFWHLLLFASKNTFFKIVNRKFLHLVLIWNNWKWCLESKSKYSIKLLNLLSRETLELKFLIQVLCFNDEMKKVVACSCWHVQWVSNLIINRVSDIWDNKVAYKSLRCIPNNIKGTEYDWKM